MKQYFKEQHALRTETTINNPMDFYVRKAVDNLAHLCDPMRWAKRFLEVSIAHTTAASVKDRRSTEGSFPRQSVTSMFRCVEACAARRFAVSTHLARV